MQMSNYQKAKEQLQREPKTWLVTGAAGFIASNLVEELLRLNQRVVGLDNYSTGHRRNLDEVKAALSADQWSRFTMREGDITRLADCRQAAAGADFVLHHAAVGSVPRSIDEPLFAHEVNVTGTLHVLVAAQEAKAQRFVYATSSAVYGDDPTLPKVEPILGNCLSPYAVSKLANELYAQVFGRCYGAQTVGLRYFNIFGPRQDPEGAYAAVIPKWISAMIHGQDVIINGDGETTRDFCYVADVVQANILAATTENPAALNRVFNVARHSKTTLNELYEILRSRLAPFYPPLANAKPVHRDFRAGDVRHSEASIDEVQRCLGFAPAYSVAGGLDEALAWYRENLS
jgi:UDP-N-acetylglucosamine 4-epimerase